MASFLFFKNIDALVTRLVCIQTDRQLHTCKMLKNLNILENN